MTPSNVILDKIVTSVANDTAGLAPAALAVHVHLAMAPFVPSPTLLVGDMTEADFAGSTPLDAGVGPQQQFTDPATGLEIVQLLEPAGGWHWQSTSGLNLPQTIYGYYVTDNADAVLFGSGLLPLPITLTASGQNIDIAQIRLVFSKDSPY